MLRNKTATECRNILKYVIVNTIDQYVPLKKTKENGLERNICQKKLIETYRTQKNMNGPVVCACLTFLARSAYKRNDLEQIHAMLISINKVRDMSLNRCRHCNQIS